jgi:hypothetical protein
MAGIAIAIIILFIPLNVWLLESVKHVPIGLQDASNRNFVATLVNQSLQIIILSTVIINLYMLIQISKTTIVTQSKDNFKKTHPSIPDHYLETEEEQKEKEVGGGP